MIIEDRTELKAAFRSVFGKFWRNFLISDNECYSNIFTLIYSSTCLSLCVFGEAGVNRVITALLWDAGGVFSRFLCIFYKTMTISSKECLNHFNAIKKLFCKVCFCCCSVNAVLLENQRKFIIHLVKLTVH